MLVYCVYWFIVCVCVCVCLFVCFEVDSVLQNAHLFPTQILHKVEHAQAVIALDPKSRPTVRTGKFGCVGPKVDAEQHFLSELEDKNHIVQNLQKEAKELPKYGPAAFVTFDTPVSASTASQVCD